MKEIRIAYIGGGSRAWARNLMCDLAKENNLTGTVALYDTDKKAAEQNAVIGNALSKREDIKGKWRYVAIGDLSEALKRADFVIISILPGTFDEMESDVHTPEKYGIYQSVGDTTGPGGTVRALRTLPMFREFATAIKEVCPSAWVINFTNPMTLCVRMLYEVFPEIKAFGCCHEVFGTQRMLAEMLNKRDGIKVDRNEIDINVLGVNHFTWIDSAKYKGEDLFPLYREYAEGKRTLGVNINEGHWANNSFVSEEKVKFDLFIRYGLMAAAGDRHLAEFCPGDWYLKDHETVEKYRFRLTSVKWRKQDLKERIKKTEELLNGKPFELYDTGEESVRQIKALLGEGSFITNVNLPNRGQIDGLPLGAVVETNAFFSGDSVRPVYAGKLPVEVNALVSRIVYNQELIIKSVVQGDYEIAFRAFVNDPNVMIGLREARSLFDEMLYNTRNYLPDYENYVKRENQK